MSELEKALKLLEKSVNSLKKEKKGLEIDLLSLKNITREQQRKLYNLKDEFVILLKQKDELTNDIVNKRAIAEDFLVKTNEEIKNKRNLFEIEEIKIRKELKDQEYQLQKDKENYLTQKQALEIFELDLRKWQEEINKEKEILRTKESDFKKIIEKEKNNLTLKINENDSEKRKLLEERQKIDKDRQEINEETKNIEIKVTETETKLKEATFLLETLNNKSLKLKEYQRKLDQQIDTLNKKSFIIEGKERDLRHRELKLADREATFNAHSRL